MRSTRVAQLGANLLYELCREHRVQLVDAVDYFGIRHTDGSLMTPSTVYNWFSGRSRPTRLTQEHLERAWGIPKYSWWQPGTPIVIGARKPRQFQPKNTQEESPDMRARTTWTLNEEPPDWWEAETSTDTMTEAEAARTPFGRKAGMCITVAKLMLPKASEADTEDQALAFMGLSDSELLATVCRLLTERAG